MSYRKFDTGTWQDPWFENLGPEIKLSFIYFWTNDICNQAGIYEISKKRILFELGYHIDTISIPLKPKIIWYPEKNIVWVKNFFAHQCQNPKFAVAALNGIKDDPFRLQIFISENRGILDGYKIDLNRYHIDTISIPSARETEQNSTVQIKEPQIQNVKKHTSKFKPQKKTPAKNAGTFKPKNNNVKNEDFTINLSNTFLKINSICDDILKLPKNSDKKKKFNPRAWAQKKISLKKHPGAIEKSLDGLKIYWDRSRNPWSYCDNILSKVNGTFNEADAIQMNEEFKKLSGSPELISLTAGLFGEI